MARLLRREGKFFDFFNEHADLAILAAAELKLLLEDIGDLELRRRNIERYEKQFNAHILHAWGMTEMSPIGTVSRLKSYMADWPEEQRYKIRAKQGLVLPGVT